jgi:hypothetical protein
MATNSDIFLITSVINTGNAAWSYTATRSVFTPQERFEQTLETIESIRKYHGSARIFLAECSDLSESMTQALTEKVEAFFQFYDDPAVRSACLQSEKKGYGEAQKTLKVVEYLLANAIEFNRLFKISGRYYLNEQFNAAAFSSDAYTFHKVQSGTRSTVLYSVPFPLLSHFHTVLLHCNAVYARQVIGYEVVLPQQCTPVHSLDVMGVSGKVAVDAVMFTA